MYIHIWKIFRPYLYEYTQLKQPYWKNDSPGILFLGKGITIRTIREKHFFVIEQSHWKIKYNDHALLIIIMNIFSKPL